jgi:hypothetical protein
MWQVGAAANATVAVAYIAISIAILRPLVRGRQLRSNPLGTATAAIFLTCAVHHGSHSVHALLPAFGLEMHEGLAMRTTFGWHTVPWDVLTAAVGVYYWTLRRTYGPLMRGAQLFEDLKDRQRRALEINDNIVQGLYVAQTALALDQRELSEEALRTTLEAAREIISELLGRAGSEVELGPGELSRDTAALSTPGQP